MKIQIINRGDHYCWAIYMRSDPHGFLAVSRGYTTRRGARRSAEEFLLSIGYDPEKYVGWSD